MSTISLGRSGIVGISYSETSLLKSNLMRANERRNSASNNINSAKVKLQVNGRSGRIRVETDNLQSYYSSLKSNNSKIEKIIRDIDYIVRRFKEVDSRCASRVRAISKGYKVQSFISKIGNTLISFGNKVFNGVSNFLKDGISIIKNIYNSSISWTNSYGFYRSLSSENFNLGMYPGLAMAGMGVGAGVTTLGPIISGGVANSNKGIEEYLKKSFKQVILGEFTNTDDITLLGTVGEIGVGFTPVGIIQDGRDLVKCFVDWEWSWKHVGWTAFGLVALIPGVSELKKLFKGIGNVSDVAKDTSKVVKNIDKIDEVSDTIKGISKSDIRDRALKNIEESKIAREASNYQEFAKIDTKIYAENNNWMDKAGSIIWPPNRGFDGEVVIETLKPGTRIDRYGFEGGTFVSPEGIPYSSRALAPGTEKKPYNVYEVIKPIEVQAGKIAPWFNEPGGGIQYELSISVKKLIEDGFIRRVGIK